MFALCLLLPIWRDELKISKNESVQQSEPVPSFYKNSRKGQGMMKHFEKGAQQAEDIENDS